MNIEEYKEAWICTIFTEFRNSRAIFRSYLKYVLTFNHIKFKKGNKTPASKVYKICFLIIY